MGKIKALLVVALITVSVATFAQDLGFKGIPFGSPKEDLVGKFPALECKPPPGRSFAALGEEVCSQKPGTDFELTRPLNSYGGQPAMEASFGVVGGRLGRFSMTFSPDKYDAIRNSLSEAYGPGKETTTTRQTRSGAAFSSRTFTVTKPGGTITVMEHAGRIDQGAVDGRSPAFSAYVERVMQGDPKAGSKDL